MFLEVWTYCSHLIKAAVQRPPHRLVILSSTEKSEYVFSWHNIGKVQLEPTDVFVYHSCVCVCVCAVIVIYNILV